MSSTSQSIAQMASDIKLKDCLTISINSQFLEMNFNLIKQCLIKMDQLDKDFKDEKAKNHQLYERLNYIQRDIASNKSSIEEQDGHIKAIQKNLGEQFMKKIQQLQEKSRGVHDIEKLVKQIQGLNRFVSSEHFQQFEGKTNDQINNVGKIRSDLEKYVQQGKFNEFKDQTSMNFQETSNNLENLKEQTKNIDGKIGIIDEKATKASDQVNQNNNMLKEINFTDMQQKIKKFKEESEARLGQMSMKLKKKVGVTQLGEVQKSIIQKLDKFLQLNEKAKADKDETKEALSFLQKRVNQIIEILSANQEGQDNDPMFTTKKWMCASCSKDLGKFEGKLGQFKPWSVFPCRQLDPEKTGAFGYLNYVDKMAYKKGYSIDDTGVQRLNKTFFEKNRDTNSPKKMNSTRATNFMSNYGTSERNTVSLKDEYFKAPQRGSKYFRVKKQLRKQLNPENAPERVKEITPASQE